MYPMYPHHHYSSYYSASANPVPESTRRLIAEDILISVNDVRSVRIDENTDAFVEKHVIIDFDTHSVELAPQYTFDEIRNALNGGCYYRSQYLDQAGNVDVCVVHDDISEYDSENGTNLFRLCRRNDPMGQYLKYSEAVKEYYKDAATDETFEPIIEENDEEEQRPQGFWARLWKN